MISCSRWVSLRLFLPSHEIFLPCKGCPLCSTETSAVRQNRAHLDDFSFSPNFRSKEVPIFQKSGNYWVTEGVSFTYKKLVFPGLPELSSSHVLSIASFLFKRKGALAWAPCFWQVLYPFGGLLVSRSVVSISLQSHGLQHSRLPCPLLSPRVGSDSCPLSWWCHPTISSSVIPFSSYPPIPPSIRVFSNESTLHMRWPKYWSFNISPSNEHSGLISFRIDWLDLLAVQGTL